MTQGIIVGIAISIIAFAFYKLVIKLVSRHVLKKHLKELDEMLHQQEGEPRQVNLKQILDSKFGPMIEERDRLLKEQNKRKI